MLLGSFRVSLTAWPEREREELKGKLPTIWRELEINTTRCDEMMGERGKNACIHIKQNN